MIPVEFPQGVSRTEPENRREGRIEILGGLQVYSNCSIVCPMKPKRESVDVANFSSHGLCVYERASCTRPSDSQVPVYVDVFLHSPFFEFSMTKSRYMCKRKSTNGQGMYNAGLQVAYADSTRDQVQLVKNVFGFFFADRLIHTTCYASAYQFSNNIMRYNIDNRRLWSSNVGYEFVKQLNGKVSPNMPSAIVERHLESMTQNVYQSMGTSGGTAKDSCVFCATYLAGNIIFNFLCNSPLFSTGSVETGIWAGEQIISLGGCGHAIPKSTTRAQTIRALKRSGASVLEVYEVLMAYYSTI